MRALGTVSAEMLVSAETMVPPGPKCRLSRWQLPYPEMDEKWANIAPRPPPTPVITGLHKKGKEPSHSLPLTTPETQPRGS